MYLKTFVMLIALCSTALVSTGCDSSTAELPSIKSLETPAHHTPEGFKNLYIDDGDKNFFSFVNMRLFGPEQWAEHQALAAQVPTQSVNIERLHNPSTAGQVTWLGHSMFLLQHQGVTVLTDPIFSDYASPLSFTGPKRYIPHMMNYSKLPDIDIVVISHNHYDHLDTATIMQLGNTPQYYVPLGLKAWFIDAGINPKRVIEMDWWDMQQANTNTQIHATPSQHWSARGLGDRLETLWASWVITIGDYQVFFAGDTGYNPVQFKAIGAQFKHFDLALIPIGAYAPRWFMKNYHVNPEEAVQIYQDVRAKKAIGMHWGTYPLTAEAPIDPVLRLSEALIQQQTSTLTLNFGVFAIGETRDLHRLNL